MCWRWGHLFEFVLVLANWLIHIILFIHIGLRFLKATSVICRSHSAEVLARLVVSKAAWIALHHKEEISISWRLVAYDRRVFVPLSHLHHLLLGFQSSGNQSLPIIRTFQSCIVIHLLINIAHLAIDRVIVLLCVICSQSLPFFMTYSSLYDSSWLIAFYDASSLLQQWVIGGEVIVSFRFITC